jgi:peptide/nickel transport system substrate-binding protein
MRLADHPMEIIIMYFSVSVDRLARGAAFLAVMGVPMTALAEDTLRAAPHAELQILDPFYTTAYITRSHGYLVYDTLFALDEEFEPQPQMVSDWSVSEDGLQWEFTLRPGQLWHDGTAVTADDAVASLQRWAARDGVGQAMFTLVSSIEAVDEERFVISLTSPFPRMLQALAKMSSNVPFILPRRLAETPADVPITDPTGSGPYMLVLDEMVPGERVVYQRNDNYVPRDEPTSLAAGAKIGFMERIEWLYFEDHAAAVQALIDGEIQYLESPSTAMVDRLGSIEGITLEVTDPTGNVGMAVFNHLVPPFDNRRMRQAVIAAMSQEDYMRAALGPDGEDYWRVCASVYPCDTPYATPVADPIFVRGDLDLARRLLEEAGYDGTPVVILDPVDSPVISAFTGVTLALFDELGIAVDHQEMRWSELVERRTIRTAEDGEVWNMFHTWWIADDLSDPLRVAFSGDPQIGWIGWPSAPELADLRLEFLLSETELEAAETAEVIQSIVVARAHFAILGQFFEPIAFDSSLLGTQRPIQMYYNLALPPSE